MPIDFPTSPSPDQVYSYGGRSWRWNGISWTSITTSSTNVVYSVNGQTGSAYAYGYFHGFTSNADLFTFPDGNTGNVSNNQPIYYVGSAFGTISNTRAARPERIYFNPFHLPKAVEMQNIRFSVNTSVTGDYILAIYDVNEYGFPKNRLYSSGTQAVPAANANVTISPSGLTVGAGSYWFAMVFSSSPDVRCWNSNLNGNGVPLGSKAFGSGYYNQSIASEGSGFTMPENTSGLTLRFNDYFQSTNCTTPFVEFRIR